MKKYVLGFLFDEEDRKVALILKRRPKWQSSLYNGVGGEIEGDEKPLSAMVREFEEETGAVILDHCWEHVITLISMQFDSIVYIFKANGKTGLLESKTDEQVCKIDYIDLPHKVVPNLRWMIPLILSDIQFPLVIFENKVIA